MFLNRISIVAASLISSSIFAAGLVKTPQSATPSAQAEIPSPESSGVRASARKASARVAEASADEQAEPTPVKATAVKAPSSTFVDAKPMNPRGKMTSLGEITTDVEGESTIVTARLNKVPEWKDVVIEEHGTFLQIKMANTQIPASGEFIDGNGPYLKKIATFQLPNEDGALRLFINQDAVKAKQATTAELLGDRLIITIDHTKLEQLIMPQAMKTQGVTASDIVAKTTVEKNQAAPGDLITSNAAEPSKSSDSSSFAGDLRSQLTKAAAFFAVLLLALAGSQIVRTKRRKSGKFSFGRDISETTSMKILSSIPVGQKQKLTLVQVGQQEILIGVGPESINLITVIESKPKVNQFARHLDAAGSNSEIRLKSPNEAAPTAAPRRPLSASTTRPATQAAGQSSGQSSSASANQSPVRGNRINVGVGDEGPTNMNASASKKNDDITRILRDRLRNLPPG